MKFGAANTDLAKETNQVVITGTTSNTIAYGSTVDVKALTVADKATTVKGALKAAATTIGANPTRSSPSSPSATLPLAAQKKRKRMQVPLL